MTLLQNFEHCEQFFLDRLAALESAMVAQVGAETSQQLLSGAATVTIDGALASVFVLNTITNDPTVIVQNVKAGQTVHLLVKQNNSGGHFLTADPAGQPQDFAGGATQYQADLAPKNQWMTFEIVGGLAGRVNVAISAFPFSREPLIEGGVGLLAAGVAAIPATMTLTTRVVVTMRDPGGGAIPLFAALNVPAAGRVLGTPGSFTVNAINDAGAVIATAACSFDWVATSF